MNISQNIVVNIALLICIIGLICKQLRLNEKFKLSKQQNEQLNTQNKYLSKQVNLDPLTGLFNRGALMDAFTRSLHIGCQYQTQLSFIFIDVDYFKQYNDQYGHVAGDECLKDIAKTLKSVAQRSTDIVARYGGEEFAIILDNSDKPELIAESCRNAVESLHIKHSKSSHQLVTVSIGVFSCTPNIDSNINNIIHMADNALYQAKLKGRNCVVVEN